MSLKEARRIIRRLRHEGIAATIEQNRTVCRGHNPNAHPMSGIYVVAIPWDGPGDAQPRYVWE